MGVLMAAVPKLPVEVLGFFIRTDFKIVNRIMKLLPCVPVVPATATISNWYFSMEKTIFSCIQISLPGMIPIFASIAGSVKTAANSKPENSRKEIPFIVSGCLPKINGERIDQWKLSCRNSIYQS